MLAAFFTLMVTVALLLDGQRLLGIVRDAMPRRRQDQAEKVGGLLYRIVGRYFAGSLLVALCAATGILIVGLTLRIPLAPLAALWVMFTNLIPQIGGLLGGVPFVLLGLSRSPLTGVVCLVWFLGYQQFENHLLQPAIVGQAVNLSPPVTMMAALIGGSTAGVPGALVAVPVAGLVKAVYLELRGAPTAPTDQRRVASRIVRPPANPMAKPARPGRRRDQENAGCANAVTPGNATTFGRSRSTTTVDRRRWSRHSPAARSSPSRRRRSPNRVKGARRRCWPEGSVDWCE